MSAPVSLSEPAFPPLRINPELVRKILVGFIQNEVRKVGFERVVLGLSGGVDSSLVATLAAEALGPKNVLGVIMPYRTSDPKSMSDALQVVRQLGSAPLEADIWSGQSDETELGFQYRMIDQLLYYLVDRRYSVDELKRQGFDQAFITEIVRRVRENQYKRRLPLIAKLSSRTIDREFRYPRH